MAKTPMLCPFNDKICAECQIYRGRHYYMCICESYRGYIKPKNKVQIDGHVPAVDMATIKRLFEPWSGARSKPRTDTAIKIKLIDMENGVERYCDIGETKSWKWGDTEIMRVINGTHVTSWEKLLEMLRYQEEKGTQEVIIYEAPRFMLLGGG